MIHTYDNLVIISIKKNNVFDGFPFKKPNHQADGLSFYSELQLLCAVPFCDPKKKGVLITQIR